jgi:hypothetical protein
VTGRTPQGRKRYHPCAAGCGRRTTAEICNACAGHDQRGLVTWPVLMEHAAGIVRSYDTEVTLRQLFYRLVADGSLPNTANYYRRLGAMTAERRRKGTFPELADNSSRVIRYQAFDGPQDGQDWLCDVYRRDRTEGQPWTIYLAVEKNALATQLDTWFSDPMGIPVYPLGGYASQPRIDEIRRDVESQGRPAVLIYAGDHDPSGEDIDRDFIARTDCWDKVVRVALSREQVEQYSLPVSVEPEVAAKIGRDPRAGAFLARHGDLVQVELDALPPDVLRNLYRDIIGQYWDDDAYADVLEREEDERDQLSRLRLPGEDEL